MATGMKEFDAVSWRPTVAGRRHACASGHYLATLAAQRDALSDTLTVTLEVRRGEVVDELQAAVERADADLVVMSTHGRAGLEGLWTGSVASKLIGRLTRPVILVPIPRGPATD